MVHGEFQSVETYVLVIETITGMHTVVEAMVAEHSR